MDKIKKFLKNMVKFRMLKLFKLFRLIFTLYTFQRGRWDIGLTLDIDGTPLFSINLIFIHLEIEYYTKQQEELDKNYEKFWQGFTGSNRTREI